MMKMYFKKNTNTHRSISFHTLSRYLNLRIFFIICVVLMISRCFISLRSLSRRELDIYSVQDHIIGTSNDVIISDELRWSSIGTITNNNIVSNSSNDTTQSIATLINSCNDNDESSPIEVFSNGNKTLVIIIGSLRGGEPAWLSLYRQVLDVNYADLALLVGAKSGDKDIYPNNSTLYNRAKYRWEFEDPVGDWKKELYDMFEDMKAGDPSLKDVNWEQRFRRLQLISQNHTGLFGPIEGKRGSGAIIFIIRHWLTKKLQELNLVNVYERFVITRSDHYYKCAHNLSMLSNDKVWVPTGSDYGGITDRHIVVNNRHVLKALDIYPALFRNPTTYIPVIDNLAPERLIDAVWRQHCLRPAHFDQFPRIMFTCGSAGDETRWKKYGRAIAVGNNTVLLKYEQEYHESSQTCKKQKLSGQSKVHSSPATQKIIVKNKSNQQGLRIVKSAQKFSNLKKQKL